VSVKEIREASITFCASDEIHNENEKKILIRIYSTPDSPFGPLLKLLKPLREEFNCRLETIRLDVTTIE